MRIVADTSDVEALAAMYAGIPDRAEVELGPVVERGALNIKNGARELVRAAIRGLYLPHYARSIGYDVESGPGWVEAETGPNAGMPQGGMGRGVEYGSAHTAPTPHLIPAWEDEIPRFEQQIDAGIGRALP